MMRVVVRLGALGLLVPLALSLGSLSSLAPWEQPAPPALYRPWPRPGSKLRRKRAKPRRKVAAKRAKLKRRARR